MNIQEMANKKLTKLALTLPDFHTKSPADLERETNIPAQTWYDFINNSEEIRQFIHRRTNEDIEFAHRRALTALAKEAQKGNVQAIKELNNLSGILNQQNNKQIITHYIPRPSKNQNQNQNHKTKRDYREQRIAQIMEEQEWSKEDAEEWYDYNESGEEDR